MPLSLDLDIPEFMGTWAEKRRLINGLICCHISQISGSTSVEVTDFKILKKQKDFKKQKDEIRLDQSISAIV